ncbi:MAG TPA: DUF4339 domain-containing protein, partial [Flavisolibacter sp.]|nr:DUF4339 domain-containing protein [Flavisolibacter sp.]
MKNYFILDGQQESGPYTLDMLKSKGLTPGTLIRLQNSSCWIAAVKIEEFAKFILPPDSSEENKTIQKRDHSKKILFAIKTYKMLIPIFIALAIGSITISMGSLLGSKREDLRNSSIVVAKTPEKTIIKKQ